MGTRLGLMDSAAPGNLFTPSSATIERIRKQPEGRLLLAVLKHGLATYMKNAFATSKRDQRLYQEAQEWIMQDDATWLCSFVSICHVLGIDTDYLRAGLERWRTEQEAKALNEAA